MKLLVNKKFLAALFILAEAAIYIAILVTGGTTDYNLGYIQISGICLCFVAAVVCAVFYGQDGIFIAVAFVFTAIGDLFLVVIKNYIEIGISSFFIVQVVYFCRMYLIKRKKPYIGILIRLVVIGIVLAVMGGLSKLTSAAVILVCIYYPVIVINGIEAFFLVKYSKRYLLFAVGLLLFAVCDMLVGLNNFAMIGLSLPPKALWFIGRIAIWMIYLPSQVMLVFSVKQRN